MGRSRSIFLAVALLSAIFVFSTVSYALEITIEPSDGDLQVHGQSRVYIFATSAESLISMGIEISFDPEVLEVVTSEKNDVLDNPANVWRMTIVKNDGTTLSHNTPPVQWDNTAGTVTLIGGHSYENMQTGVSTSGLSGKVLLGWIDFRAKADGQSNISVDLARYHPLHPTKTFANFVSLNTGVDEPTNLGILSVVHAMRDSDDDGLFDTFEEDVAGTDPLMDDTDGDGITDDEEDMDFDGMSNAEEYARGTHPREPDIYLFAGLNLVGYPVNVSGGYSSFDLLADLGTEDEVSKIQRYNFDTGIFETTTYDAGAATGDEFDIVTGEGYFVYMKEAKRISFTGAITTPIIALKPGFNIVSVPCMPPGYSSHDLINYLGSANEVGGIQRFDRKRGSFETTDYYNGQVLGTPFNINNGEAYLIHMKAPVELPPLLTAPVVVINSHGDGETVAGSSIDISGSVSDSTSAVTVNGVKATVSAGTFTATGVTLNEGPNTITATAVSANNLMGTHAVTVILVVGD